MHRVYFFIVICITACSRYPADVERALKLAGDNRAELERVLEHYRMRPEDSLKYRAACFLIGNMPEYYGVPNYLVDMNGSKVNSFDAASYQDAGKALRAMDSLQYRFQRDEPVNDAKTINSGFLIENIDLAFDAWQKPWAQHLVFDQFCETILPYRASIEPVSDFRKYFINRFSNLVDSVCDPSDVVAVADYVRKKLLSAMMIDDPQNQQPYIGVLDPFELEKIRNGTCAPMVTYATLAYRALGIPTLYVEIYCWNNDNSGHAFNMIIANDSNRYYVSNIDDPFPPCNMKENRNIPAKAFIRTFGKQKNELRKIKTGEAIPPLFLDQHLIDATHIFHPTDSLRLGIENYDPGFQLIYLCKFIYGEWKPITITRNISSLPVFQKIAKNNIYTIGYFNQGRVIPVTEPFLFNHANNITFHHATEETAPIFTFPVLVEGEPQLEKQVTVYYWSRAGWKPTEGTGRLYSCTNSAWIPAETITKIHFTDILSLSRMRLEKHCTGVEVSTVCI